jgi:hypothetical protein
MRRVDRGVGAAVGSVRGTCGDERGMSKITIRSMVREIQREIRDADDLMPDRAADLLAKLTALLGNIADEQRAAEAAFNAVLVALLDSEEAAARAQIRAKVTPEYARMREAKDTATLAVELIRSLKVFLRTKQEEMRLAR